MRSTRARAELLVRCLARAGEVGAARHHANACDVLFRRELGRAPDPRVRRAADDHGLESEPAVGDRAAAIGQLEAGRAAVAAGAVEPGIACLRQACAEARGVGEPQVLLARVLVALGVALVHGIRGRDEEGAAVLHEALLLAEAASGISPRRSARRARVRGGAGWARGVSGQLAAARHRPGGRRA